VSSKAHRATVRPTANAQQHKHLSRPLCIEKVHRSAQDRTSIVLIQLPLRSVSSKLLFFAATIQADGDILDPPHKELERLIKGAPGYMVKIEDISLQLLVCAKSFSWLITGFPRNIHGATSSEHDATYIEISAATDMETRVQALHGQGVDATATLPTPPTLA
jgi:hypothetical protein